MKILPKKKQFCYFIYILVYIYIYIYTFANDNRRDVRSSPRLCNFHTIIYLGAAL